MNDRPNLTDAEARVLDCLASAWDGWAALGDKHPDDDGEFRRAIHAAQHMIAYRVARRVDPDDWWQPKMEGER